MSRHKGPFRIPCRHGREGSCVVVERGDGTVGFGVGFPLFGSAANATFGGGGCLEGGGCLAELHDGSVCFDGMCSVLIRMRPVQCHLEREAK